MQPTLITFIIIVTKYIILMQMYCICILWHKGRMAFLFYAKYTPVMYTRSIPASAGTSAECIKYQSRM